jgi:hypothetical protein
MFKRIVYIAMSLLFVFVAGVCNSETKTGDKGATQGVSVDSGKAPAIVDVPKDSRLGESDHQEGMIRFQRLQAPIPGDWVVEEPANRLRLVQIQVPAADDAEEGELVVYYFGPSLGKVDDHIARWKSQFSGPDGAPVEPVVTNIRIEDMPVTLVEFQGNYARNLGVGPSKTVKNDQTMLVAIIEGDDGLVFVQLHGPAATVRENRVDFDSLIKGIRIADSN